MAPFWQKWVIPRSADAMMRRREAALYVLIASGLGAALLWVVAGLVFIAIAGPHRRLVGDVVVGLEGLLLSAIAYMTARRGAIQVGIYVALSSLLVMQLSSMFIIWQYPVDPTFVFYALVIALAGLLLGRKGALFFYICSVVVYAVAAMGLFLGGFRFSEITQVPTMLMMTLMLALILGMLLLVVNIYIGSLEQALKDAEEQVRVRTQELEVAYQDMAQQRTRLDIILRNVADGLVVTDLQDRISLVNPVLSSVVGRPAEELIGQPLSQAFPNEALGQIVSQARQEPAAVFTANAVWFGRVYQALACTLGTAGESPSGVVTVLHDITQEIEAIDARTQFVSAVAHELRVPLTSIQGFCDLLLDELSGPLTAEQRSYLASVTRSTERMAVLVRDLLDLCRLESGRVQIEASPASLRNAVEEVTGAMRPQLEVKNLALEVQLPGDLPLVLADPHRLNQVLTNLVANACKYTPPGGQISVLARHLPPPQVDTRHCPDVQTAYVEAAVRDTGIGIPPEDQERVFERFVRLDHPLVEQAGGTGLGLTIVRQLLQLQGGRIWVESALGQGSTFLFTLPAVE